jgi:hypothetical protein
MKRSLSCGRSRCAGIVRSVLTDLEGRFKVQDVPKGTYDIAVEEEGYEAAQNLNITLIAWTPSARAQVSKFEEAAGEISGTVLLESGSGENLSSDVTVRPSTIRVAS